MLKAGLMDETRSLSLLLTMAAPLGLLLGLHPSVLEPDLDLPLRQAKGVGDLYPPPPRKISV